MLKNVIFDFGNVLYRYDPDYLLGCFFENAEDVALAKPVIYRKWQALDEGTIDYDEYVEETAGLLSERLREPARRFFYHWFWWSRPLNRHGHWLRG